MKTEQSAASHAQKIARGGNAAKPTSTVNGTVGADASGASGFLSLLTLFDSELNATDKSIATLLASDLPLPVADEKPTPLLLDDQSLVAGQASNLDQADSAMLLSQLGQRAVDPVGTQSGGARSAKVAVGAAKSNASGETTAPNDSGADDLSAGFVTSDKGLHEIDSGKKNALIVDMARAKSEHAHNQANAALDIRADRLLHLTQVNESATFFPLANLAGNSDAANRQSERERAKPISSRTGLNPEGAWGPQSLYGGGPLDVLPTSAADALVAPELMVAEQVNYWISQDVQNAEMKLDGFDGLPVEVSIKLEGNEARVDFRTDQEGIREVLQNTESHLKDMLAKEGLVLSGVSVGASNQEGRGASERKEPENKRRAEIPVAAPVSAASVRMSTGTSGKSIDVFV